MDEAERLARFVAGLGEGHRHQGFFWAAMTAAHDQVPADGVKLIEEAAVGNGLAEAYVRRTMDEARDRAKGASVQRP